MSKATGLVITIATGVLFGCPGLFLLVLGIFAIVGNTTNDSLATQGTVVILLVGVILIIVPIAVGFFALRTKPEEPAGALPTKSEGPASNEPLSPD